ncbi:MAG: hypothetical protein ABGW78_03255, partial [Pirellulales bacterium]
MAIQNEDEWNALTDVIPQAGDIMIKKVFRIHGLLDGAICTGQRAYKYTYDRGHHTSEHAAICIGPNFVAEAEGNGIVANSLATDDRKTTKYIVYRCQNRDVTTDATRLAEMVARGRNNLQYDKRNRHTGGGYALSAGVGAMIRPISPQVQLMMHAAAPAYLKNIIDYAEGRTNDRMWAYCSMFACAVYEAACITQDGGFDRFNYRQGPNYRQYALKLNPYHVTPIIYEDRLERHTAYDLRGKFIFDRPDDNNNVGKKAIDVLEGLKQAVEDYHKTHRGGGVGGGQALKIRFGLRRVSPESQKALEELSKAIKDCDAHRNAKQRFYQKVDFLSALVVHLIQYQDHANIERLMITNRGRDLLKLVRTK